jgi:hypothetical protein
MVLAKLISIVLLVISLAMLIPIGFAVHGIAGVMAFSLWLVTAGYFFYVTELR